MQHKDIYSLIRSEEQNYKLSVNIAEGWDWNAYDHIRKTTLYKNSQYTQGTAIRPFKNIIRPILNLAYRAEGFDVKDIQLFVNDAKDYYKSFLIKKFHEKWARENKIDTFIDEMVESYVDYGGALIKNTKAVKPEVVPLQSLAFFDQTDLLSGPFAIKHQYSPEQLREAGKAGKWDIDAIEEVIVMAEDYKSKANEQKAETPGKYIDAYEVHGCFPANWLSDKEGYNEESYGPDEYFNQFHIVTFYRDAKYGKQGISLFSIREKELPFKLVLRDKIYGRALGLGGAEELFEPQIWVNYDIIRIKDMLDAASKVLYQTTDAAFANRNKTMNLEMGEILVVDEGKQIGQINTQPVNITVFENSIREWEQHARQMGAATESIMGEAPSAGTPFKLQELITAESHSLHEYRKGKLATFLDEIYQDWIIPLITKEITKGQEFLAELDLDELQSVADNIVTYETNKVIKEKILNGEIINPDDVATYKQTVKDAFMKGGNKKFIEILKDEMKNSPIDVYVNIAGKQKDLAHQTDKLVNVFRTIISNPAILQNPPMAKLFNQILESSGLSPIDFSGFTSTTPSLAEAATAPRIILNQIPGVPATATQPLNKLGQRPTLANQVSNK